jgi:hypothetical protein
MVTLVQSPEVDFKPGFAFDLDPQFHLYDSSTFCPLRLHLVGRPSRQRIEVVIELLLPVTQLIYNAAREIQLIQISSPERPISGVIRISRSVGR